MAGKSPPGSGVVPVQPGGRLVAGGRWGDQPVERCFGEAAVGGELAAEDGEQRGAAGCGLQIQVVVAGGSLGLRGAVVVEGADAGIRPDDLVRGDGMFEVFAGAAAEIGAFLGGGGGVGRVTLEVEIGGADEGEVAFVGDDEDDPAVGVLEDVAVVVRVEAADDDMAAFDQAGAGGGFGVHDFAEYVVDPGAGGVDHGAGADLLRLAAAAGLQAEDPGAVARVRR